jgi:photosystem II stability/assembly factor-like uncharacterized protein
MAEQSPRDRQVRDSLAAGPQKPRPRRTPSPVFSTHKVRAGWFQARETWPTREVSGQLVVRERASIQRALAEHPGTAQWQFVGPSNIGGRMTALVCHPTDPELLLAGAAAGGVWRSTNGGRAWTALWHDQPTLNIGSLAFDPANPDVVYCGTGEANLSADSHPGIGVFRSLDGGLNWQILAPADVAEIPSRIGAIAVDPFNGNHIYLGGVSHSTSGRDGLYVSDDGGMTWTRDNFATTHIYRCHTIVFHPTERDVVYVTISNAGSRNGIWRSRDGGRSWSQLTAGLPSPAAMGRASLAIAPSDPNILFALIANDRRGVLGVYRSGDGGNAWQDVAGNHFTEERQMSYNNTIAIHPTNPNHVLCGGVDLHRTTNGGNSWRQVTKWFKERGDTDYAHADHHALVMPAARPGWVYDMNDGGMDVSADGGRTWENRSNGLAVTMYYDLEVAQSDGMMFGGGTQDNGTNITLTGASDDHFMISGGDGGWIVIDPHDQLHLYVSSQQMRISRFRNNQWTDVSPLPVNNPERLRMWMVFIAMDPHDSQTVFTGTQRVFRTRDDGASWQAVSAVLDGSDITAIEIASANASQIYIGTENGGFFRSLDGGETWSTNLIGELTRHIITRIKTHPDNADTVFITIGNFGHSHVFRSDDGGLTWHDIDQGQLPDVPHHGVAIPAAPSQHVYVCSDVGVFVSTDTGVTWQNMTRNLPHVMVVDLVYHQANNTLTAATYGRSLWRLDLG